jgi:anti-sigma factor RsiW
MNCCEFREKYSDFADGLLTSRERSEAGAHLAVCAACRRFDAALRAGLDALRALPSVGVSRGFGLRLRQRLRGEFAVRVPIVARWSGAVGTLLLVATVGYIGWDLLDSRATHRDRAAWSATAWGPAAVPLAVSGRDPAPPSPRPTSADLRLSAFHPLNSILVTEEARPAAAEGRGRLDVPAVWGGP